MAALDIATSVANVKAMLGSLTAWQTITGAANAAAAEAFIYLGGYENTDDGASPRAPFCILDIDNFSMRVIGGKKHTGQLPVDMIFELAVPSASQGSYADQYEWVWEQISALLAGITAGTNGGGQLMNPEFELMLKPGQIDPKENNGRCDWLFVIRLTLTLQ